MCFFFSNLQIFRVCILKNYFLTWLSLSFALNSKAYYYKFYDPCLTHCNTIWFFFYAYWLYLYHEALQFFFQIFQFGIIAVNKSFKVPRFETGDP